MNVCFCEQFFIKTGECSFGATCRFHHPPDRIPSGIPKPGAAPAVKLSLAGLPRREVSARLTQLIREMTLASVCPLIMIMPQGLDTTMSSVSCCSMHDKATSKL